MQIHALFRGLILAVCFVALTVAAEPVEKMTLKPRPLPGVPPSEPEIALTIIRRPFAAPDKASDLSQAESAASKPDQKARIVRIQRGAGGSLPVMTSPVFSGVVTPPKVEAFPQPRPAQIRVVGRVITVERP